MRKNMQIRMAVFLCVIMVLPSILSILPITATEVSAAEDVYLGWDYYMNAGKKTIQVEQNQKFNIGDYAYIVDGNTAGWASTISRVSYASSKQSVAKLDSKGNVTTKKTGKTTITIKYKGKKISCKFQVVKAGAFGNSKAIKNLRNASKNVEKNMPKQITTSNGYKYLQIKKSFYEQANKYDTEINSSGFLKESVNMGDYVTYNTSTKLAVPQAGRSNCLDSLLRKYADKNDPTSTRSSKALKIASVSANTKEITIKVKQKVTKEHILAANISNSSLNEAVSQKTAKVYVGVYDKTANQNCIAVGTITKGSKVVTVKIGHYSYEGGKSQFVFEKLKKGHTYVIGSELSWGNGKKIKVK